VAYTHTHTYIQIHPRLWHYQELLQGSGMTHDQREQIRHQIVHDLTVSLTQACCMPEDTCGAFMAQRHPAAQPNLLAQYFPSPQLGSTHVWAGLPPTPVLKPLSNELRWAVCPRPLLFAVPVLESNPWPTV
jgi:hypothetical protein